MKPINLTLQVSYQLLKLLLAAGLMFGGMACFLPLPAVWCMGVMALVWLATAYCCLRHALLWLPTSIVTLNINNKNQLKLLRKDGQQLDVQVQANTVVTSYLTVLNCQVKESGFRQKFWVKHIIILPDAVNAEDYRQLRIWLRWAKVLEKVEVET